MNKTRFYEITQAAAKGEDLSQFVPTNAAEAALIANLGGGGATIELPSGGTKISEAVLPLTSLYFNTSMSNEEVNNIIESTFKTCAQIEEDYVGVLFIDDSSNAAFTLLHLEQDGTVVNAITMQLGSSTAVLYQSTPIMENFEGWNPDLFTDKNYITCSELVNKFGWTDLGESVTGFSYLDSTAIDVISPLVSANKDFSAGGLKGTPLEAGVECRKIFPNLNASLEDIVSAFDEYASLCVNYPHVTISYANPTTGAIYSLMATDGKNANGDDMFIIMLVNTSNQQDMIVYYMSPVTDDMLSQLPEGMTIVDGWQTQNLTEEGCFEIPSELVWDSTHDHPAEAYEVLSKVFSANKPYSDGKKKVSGTYDGSAITVTVTGDQTIDLESLLDQNKLPLKINVKVSE